MVRQSYEARLDGLQLRRMKQEDRFLACMERRWDAADAMIGELCRDGRTVFYVFPAGGQYREGQRHDLIDYLIRNNYA